MSDIPLERTVTNKEFRNTIPCFSAVVAFPASCERLFLEKTQSSQKSVNGTFLVKMLQINDNSLFLSSVNHFVLFRKFEKKHSAIEIRSLVTALKPTSTFN